MKNFLIIIGAAFVVLLEALFLFRLGIRGIRPDIIFVIVFLLAFHRPIDKSIFMVWLIGLLQDIVSQSGFGTTAFLYLVSALLISLARQIVFKEDTGIQILILFLSAWFCNILNGLGVFLYHFSGQPPIGYIIIKSVYAALYTAIFGGVVMFTFYRIRKYVRLRAGRY